MKRSSVINGKKVQVSPYRVFETSYGLKFTLKEPICLSSISDEYDRVVAKTHIANCGFIIMYKLEVIDNEYDLNEIYSMIEKGQCLASN